MAIHPAPEFEVPLNEIVLFTLKASQWGAYRKMGKDDLQVSTAQLPPEAIATLGSKRIFNKERLTTFRRRYSRAHKECLAIGTPFLSGYAVPKDRAEALSEILVALENENQEDKENLKQNYPKLLNDWLATTGKWRPIIEKSLVEWSVVDQAISFNWHAMRVVEAGDESDSTLNFGLKKASSGLRAQLLSDVAAVAQKLLKCSLEGKDAVTRKALSPLKSLRDKLIGLAFLDPKAQPLIEAISYVIGMVPEKGPIDGPLLMNLIGLTHLLSDPVRIETFAQAAQETGSIANAFGQITGNKVLPSNSVAQKALPTVVSVPAMVADQPFAYPPAANPLVSKRLNF